MRLTVIWIREGLGQSDRGKEAGGEMRRRVQEDAVDGEKVNTAKSSL